MDLGTEAEEAVERHVAETARTYDALPYRSKPMFRTHPARMAAVAWLYGLDPATVSRARVLELGCAAGDNLIPLAARFPQAQFLGIDLGRVMVEDGQARIAALGLDNIELRVESITDLGDDGEPFDYIICHGVYSWVPEPVREKILEICGRRLSHNGIAYISYNVLPGWRTLQPIRDAMRLVPAGLGEVARAQQGRALLKFLEEAAPQQGLWGRLLRHVPGLTGSDDDSYLFHEYLEAVNEPCMFIDFVDDADRHGLAYLGESGLSAMFPQAHGEALAAKVDQVADDIVQQQQILDILIGTTFRTSLLVKQSLADRIDRSSGGARLGSLFLTRSRDCQYERIADDHAKLISNGATDYTITNPMIVALLDRLFSPIPCALSLDAWVEGLDLDGLAFARTLSEFIANGFVVPLSEPLFAAPVSERPLADHLVRVDAAMGRSATANLFHAGVELTEDDRFLLPHLDGDHTHAQLAELIVTSAMEGRISLHGTDGSAIPPEDLADAAMEAVITRLEAVAKAGLLVG